MGFRRPRQHRQAQACGGFGSAAGACGRSGVVPAIAVQGQELSVQGRGGGSSQGEKCIVCAIK